MMKVLSVLWRIFILPGRYLLWDRYMHPPKGQVFQTARQRRSLPHLIFYSIVGWGLFIVLLGYVIDDISRNSQDKNLQETAQIKGSTEQTNAEPKPALSSSIRKQVF